MLRRLPVILAGAALCAGGVIRAVQNGLDGYLLAGAGLILVGAWLAMEIHDRDKE
jgi:hypothetical protein